uniref:Uncharacterized protein n=1 Tax=Arundo donax TaxID=35708 RepID=A0A0A9AS38_ARUDO
MLMRQPLLPQRPPSPPSAQGQSQTGVARSRHQRGCSVA